MIRRATLSIGFSVLTLGTAVVGCTGMPSAGPSRASDAVADGGARDAARQASRAERLLARNDNAKAVAAAEAAVAAMPGDAAYRALMGRTYLAAGRFESAQVALAEALQLDPAQGPVALSLALAQVATGEWASARATLDRHADVIPAGDHGLALALAGDAPAAVTMLTEAARDPNAGATVRQNLALALALSGKWREARVMAGVDLPPQAADQRIIDWAAFAKPQNASDQVAALLGVVPAVDPGRPEALALAIPAAAPVAVAVAEPVEIFTPAPVPPVMVAAVAPAPVASGPAGIGWAPRREIAQPLPAAPLLLRRAAQPVKVAATEAPATVRSAPAAGDWYVQLGAFENAAVARDAWSRLSTRHARLGDMVPQGMDYAHGGERFYRLSVGGFARPAAMRMCAGIKAKGGRCFVRSDAGDATARWVRRGTEVASR